MKAHKHHNIQIQGALLTCSKEKQNLVGLTISSLQMHPSAIAKAPCSNSWVHLQNPGHAEEESFEKASPYHFRTRNPALQQLMAWRWAGKVTTRELHRPVPQPGHLQLRPLHWSPHQQPLVCSARCNPLGALAHLHLTLSFPWNTGRHSCAISTEGKNDKAGETAQQVSDTELCTSLGLIYGAAV